MQDTNATVDPKRKGGRRHEVRQAAEEGKRAERNVRGGAKQGTAGGAEDSGLGR
jgi:hypothetical protein